MKYQASMLPIAAAIALALAVAGCTGYGPRGVNVGDSAQAVAERMGPPTGRYALPQGGTRLEYARGPFGKHTYMVDVDAQGRVVRWTQVLTEPNFETVQPGMAQDDVLVTLGRPSDRRGGGWQGGEVWSYRYEAVFCQWFQVSVKDGRVTSAGYGPDPLCDVNDNDLPTSLLRR
jgi:hypothetical protein